MKPNKHCLKTCYKINISKSINQLQKYIFFNQSTLEITYCERIDKQAVECSTLGTHFLVVFANYLTLLTNLKVVITQSSCSLHVVCSFLFFGFIMFAGISSHINFLIRFSRIGQTFKCQQGKVWHFVKIES